MNPTPRTFIVTETFGGQRRPRLMREERELKDWERKALHYFSIGGLDKHPAMLRAAGMVVIDGLCTTMRELSTISEETIQGARLEMIANLEADCAPEATTPMNTTHE